MGEWIKRKRGDESKSASPNKRFSRLKFSKFLILKIRGKAAPRIRFMIRYTYSHVHLLGILNYNQSMP